MGYRVNFIERLIALSEASEYDEAIDEWSVVGFSKGSERCICSHPIFNQYIVHNDINNRNAIIGNCCIKKFGNERLKTELKVTKRIEKTIPENEAKGYRYCKYCNVKLTDNHDVNFIFHKICFDKYKKLNKNTGNYIFTFGKYKGKSYEYVNENNKEYIDWLMSQDADGKSPVWYFQQMVKKYIE